MYCTLFVAIQSSCYHYQQRGALTNYQVQVTINTQALVSAGKMQSAGQDIRVTDNDKCTALDFWFEPTTINTTTTQLWIKVPSIAASAARTIYIYYGNSSAASANSGVNTFNFFDDFSSFDASKWTATGAYSVAASELTITTGDVYSNSTVASQPNFMQEAKVRWIAPLTAGYSGLSISNSQTTQGNNAGVNKVSYYMTNSGSATVTAWAANGTVASYNITNGSVQFTAVAGTSYIVGQAITGTQVIFFNNRAITNSYSGTWSGSFFLWLGYFTGTSAGTTDITDIATDWVLVRQYVSPSPTPAIGSEDAGCN